MIILYLALGSSAALSSTDATKLITRFQLADNRTGRLAWPGNPLGPHPLVQRVGEEHGHHHHLRQPAPISQCGLVCPDAKQRSRNALISRRFVEHHQRTENEVIPAGTITVDELDHPAVCGSLHSGH